MELRIFCEFFYASHYVPVTVLQGGQVLFYFTADGMPISIPMAEISASIKNPDVFSSSDGQYGWIRLEDGSALLLGPEKRYTYNQFINLVAYLHYILNGEPFDVMEHFHTGSSAYQKSLAEFHTEYSFHAKEEQREHGTYQFENLLLSYVRDGETQKLKQFLLETARTVEFQEGVLADTPLRQAKNILIGFIGMVGKVGAIGGGMDVEEVYRLNDLYTQECEKAQTVDAVKLLQFNLLMDYTERVALARLPLGTSKEIFSAVQYIRNRTNAQIGIDDVAAAMGKSRSYITKQFRHETGKSITEFITESKLQDAKRLLRYSDKSMAEIANYLCFSSQAYFQTVFKNETGMTPGEYRKRHETSSSGTR